MAASSCCRHAKLQGVESSLTFGQKEAAALIVQSRRWSYGRVKGLLYDGFFLCRRPAAVSFQFFSCGKRQLIQPKTSQ